MQIYGMSDKGLVRESNEDAYIFKVISPSVFFAVVCDGMGGANAGNVASEYAVREISEYILRSYKPTMSGMQIEHLLRAAVASANDVIYEAANVNADLNGMGTTVVLLFVLEKTGYLLHVGDSRAYLYSSGALNQLTVDHSIVQGMIDRGEITEEEAKTHPSKNIITRALGVGSEVRSDLDFIDLNDGDVILLCSDGLSNYVSDVDIKNSLEAFDENVASSLINLANTGGGGDNITAVVVKI